MANFKEISKKKKSAQTKSDLKGTIEYAAKKEKIEVNLMKDEDELIEELLEKSYVKEAIRYITQDKKTTAQLVSGVNCSPDHKMVYDEMMIIKRLYNKEDGRLFKHYVHSYSDKEDIDPLIAHEISMKLLERQKKFEGFQIFAATHIDKRHIHTHYLLNSVNIDTGRKWQQANTFFAEMRRLSNQLCEEYGLKHSFVYEKNEKIKSKSISRGELRAKQEKRSWKHELALVINECKKFSKNREEFIKNMNELGYKVRWEDTRKYITFTTPDGKLCRNNKLENPERYTKEELEKIFSINQQIYAMSKEAYDVKIEDQGETIELEELEDIEGKDEISNQVYTEKNYSWKHPLYMKIKEGLKFCTSREEFIEHMNNAGYQVRWADSRKDITFTFPDGKRKCNSDKLHPPEKFTKKALENKFTLNRNIIQKQEIKEENRQQFEKAKTIQATQNIILETVKMLEDYPELGNKNYPLSYLEGQALREMMIEKAKGEGLDWDTEKER